jgi:hypothetical protein
VKNKVYGVYEIGTQRYNFEFWDKLMMLDCAFISSLKMKRLPAALPS